MGELRNRFLTITPGAGLRKDQNMSKILEVMNAEKYYGNKGSLTKALDDLSFSVEEGNHKEQNDCCPQKDSRHNNHDRTYLP